MLKYFIGKRNLGSFIKCLSFITLVISNYNNLYGQDCSVYPTWFQATYPLGTQVILSGGTTIYRATSTTAAPLTDQSSRCDPGHWNWPACNGTNWQPWDYVGTCTNCSVGAASSSPTPCINVAMTSITHTTSGVTGITSSSGLPAGVTASYASNTITISGTPTASGTFSYTITPTGCTTTATGTITVIAARSVSSASSSPTTVRNTVMTSVTHTTTGVTSVGSSSGLPAGVTASYSGNTITLSGTPTAVAGTYNYTITPASTCGAATATGTITVTEALPIELNSFIAEFKGKFIEISWNTTTEKNNDYFILEKTFDGKNKILVAKVKAVRNSNNLTNYIWKDKADFNGVCYYILSQVDVDGVSETFNMISVKNSDSMNINEIDMYPNPTSDHFTLEYFSDIEDEFKIIIEAANGQWVYQQNHLIDKGENIINISSKDLKRGLYYIVIENNFGRKITKKIVKN